jgi:hypothetical protein
VSNPCPQCFRSFQVDPETPTQAACPPHREIEGRRRSATHRRPIQRHDTTEPARSAPGSDPSSRWASRTPAATGTIAFSVDGIDSQQAVLAHPALEERSQIRVINPLATFLIIDVRDQPADGDFRRLEPRQTRPHPETGLARRVLGMYSVSGPSRMRCPMPFRKAADDQRRYGVTFRAEDLRIRAGGGCLTIRRRQDPARVAEVVEGAAVGHCLGADTARPTENRALERDNTAVVRRSRTPAPPCRA